MRKRVPAFLVVAVALVPGLSFAHDGERYRLEKTEDGYVRMDTRTGEMTHCTESDGRLVCRLGADERAAYVDEIDRLRAELDALDRRVAVLEQGADAPPENALPSEEEFEQTLGMMERFFRHFVDIFKDLDREWREDETAPAPPDQPDRT